MGQRDEKRKRGGRKESGDIGKSGAAKERTSAESAEAEEHYEIEASRDRKETEGSGDTADRTPVEMMKETLEALNCELKQDEEFETRYHFEYQGEHFQLDTNEGSCIFFISDLFWESCELSDVEEVTLYRRAINEAARYSGIALIYSISNEYNKFYVHTVREFAMPTGMPDVKNYMKYILGEFFRVHKLFETSLAEIKSEDKNKD